MKKAVYWLPFSFSSSAASSLNLSSKELRAFSEVSMLTLERAGTTNLLISIRSFNLISGLSIEIRSSCIFSMLSSSSLAYAILIFCVDLLIDPFGRPFGFPVFPFGCGILINVNYNHIHSIAVG